MTSGVLPPQIDPLMMLSSSTISQLQVIARAGTTGEIEQGWVRLVEPERTSMRDDRGKSPHAGERRVSVY